MTSALEFIDTPEEMKAAARLAAQGAADFLPFDDLDENIDGAAIRTFRYWLNHGVFPSGTYPDMDDTAVEQAIEAVDSKALEEMGEDGDEEDIYASPSRLSLQALQMAIQAHQVDGDDIEGIKELAEAALSLAAEANLRSLPKRQQNKRGFEKCRKEIVKVIRHQLLDEEWVD